MDQTVNHSMTPAAGFRRPRSLRPLFMKYLNPVVACPYVLLAPAMILCLIFSLLPVAYVIRSSFYQIDFVMGTESTGLSDIWRKAADAHIKIPMLGRLDSLNVSVSAAILLYEAVRQRKSL